MNLYLNLHIAVGRSRDPIIRSQWSFSSSYCSCIICYCANMPSWESHLDVRSIYEMMGTDVKSGDKRKVNWSRVFIYSSFIRSWEMEGCLAFSLCRACDYFLPLSQKCPLIRRVFLAARNVGFLHRWNFTKILLCADFIRTNFSFHSTPTQESRWIDAIGTSFLHFLHHPSLGRRRYGSHSCAGRRRRRRAGSWRWRRRRISFGAASFPFDRHCGSVESQRQRPKKSQRNSVAISSSGSMITSDFSTITSINIIFYPLWLLFLLFLFFVRDGIPFRRGL